MEPETDVVVNSALSHSLKGVFHHPEGRIVSGTFPVTKQKEHVVRGRELWSVTEAAMVGIVTLRKLAKSRVQNLFAQ